MNSELDYLMGDYNRESQRRLDRIAELFPRCEWDNLAPSHRVETYRDEYNRLLNEQLRHEFLMGY